MTRRRAGKVAWTVVAGLVGAAGLAGAARAGQLGLRTGFSVSPGQWVLGAHTEVTNEDAPIGVVPSVEAGFGDHAFSLTGQGDVVYRFPHTTGPRPYVGAGAALYFFDPQGDGSDTNGGLNLVGGVLLEPQDWPRITIDGRVRLTDRLPKARVVAAFEF